MRTETTDGRQVRLKTRAPLFWLASITISAALLAQSVEEAEAVKRCNPVIKKIYSNEGLYKANVLIVHGDVSCAEARRVIWRALKPGGFWGNIRGWQCDPKGSFDPFVEKCTKDDPRQVIKSGRPRPLRD